MDINRVLKKKKLKGSEVGKLLILNMAHLYKQALDHVKEPKPLFTSAEFSRALNSIEEWEEGQIYNRYVGLNNFLQQFQGITLSYENQVEYSVARIISTLITADTIESAKEYIAELPIIMTEKQFKEFREKRIHEQLVDEDGNPLWNDVFLLLDDAMHGLMDDLKKNPKAKNPLKPIKKKYQKEKVTSKIILSKYNEIAGEGYYTLEDGRRSDEMTREEWQQALMSPRLKKAVDAITEYSKENPSEPLEDLISDERNDSIFKSYLAKASSLYYGGSDEESDREAERVHRETGYGMNPAQWHYYDPPPADLTKWDVLELDELYSFYPALYGDDPNERLEQLRDFVNEFRELVDVVLADIDSKYFKGEKGLSSIPIEEWGNIGWEWQELYDKNFYHFRADREDDIALFSGYNNSSRAVLNGVAILREGTFNSRFIDDNGHYKDPSTIGMDMISQTAGLDQYTKKNKNYIANLERLESDRETILHGLKWLYGYNKALELTADYIDLPELMIFRADVKQYEQRVDALNGLIFFLYRRIHEHRNINKHGGNTAEEQEQKLEVLRDNFTPLDYEKYKNPPAQKLQQAKEALAGLKVYEIQNGTMIKLLAEYDDSELEADQSGSEGAN